MEVIRDLTLSKSPNSQDWIVSVLKAQKFYMNRNISLALQPKVTNNRPIVEQVLMRQITHHGVPWGVRKRVSERAYGKICVFVRWWLGGAGSSRRQQFTTEWMMSGSRVNSMIRILWFESWLRGRLKMKEESEKVGLKLNIQKTKIMAYGPIAWWQIDGETMEAVRDYFGGIQNHQRWWLQPWN